MSRDYSLDEFADATGNGDAETAESTPPESPPRDRTDGGESPAGESEPTDADTDTDAETASQTEPDGDTADGDTSTDTADGDSSADTASTAAESGQLATPSVDPIQSTYSSSSERVECPRCGERVSERWRDGSELLCPDCKDW